MNINFNIDWKRVYDNRFIYPVVFALMLTWGLWPYYYGGTIILGGEGNYVINFSNHLETTSHVWYSRFGTGMANMLPSATGMNIYVLAWVEQLTGSIAITNFVLVFLMYYFPLLGMYLLARELGGTPHLAFTIAMFYVINPFTQHYLTSMNQWNVTVTIAIPFLSFVIKKYYFDNLKLFLYYGAASAILSFVNTNPPLTVILNISSILMVYIISFYCRGKILLREILKKVTLVVAAFILFNLGWLGCFFYTTIDALRFYDVSLAKAWLVSTVASAGTPLGKSISLTHITYPSDIDFIGYWFNIIPSWVITLIPILLVVSWFFFIRKTRFSRLITHLLIITLGALFLLKGTAPPFGAIYTFLFEHIPFFSIFKTPIAKFGLLYVFLLSILLLFVLHSLRKVKVYPKVLLLFSLYLLFCAVPLLSGNILPDLNVKTIGWVSRKYQDKPDYQMVRDVINKSKLVSRILSLPGMGNYQVLFQSDSSSLYSGTDPLLMNTNKALMVDHLSMEARMLYKNIWGEGFSKLVSMFNIEKLVLNKDQISWYGLVGPANAQEIRQRFINYEAKDFKGVTIYDNLPNFLPIVYTPESMFIVSS